MSSRLFISLIISREQGRARLMGIRLIPALRQTYSLRTGYVPSDEQSSTATLRDGM